MKEYRNFKLAIYFTARCAEQASDLARLEEDFSFFEKYVHIGKVYLETHRGDLDVSREKMLAVKSFFQRKGIEVSGGITTTLHTARDAEKRLCQAMCYTDPEQLEKLAEIAEYTASLFDEFIIDDFYFFNCTCASCRQAKGNRSWDTFRLEHMTEVSRKYVIEPAKRVNPHVNIIIKYPTWSDAFQQTGYNPETQPDLFDAVYAGTETRDTTFSHFRNPRYTSYSLIRWLETLKAENNAGGWFDPYTCSSSLNNYVEQAYMTLFSKTREMTLFCYKSLLNTAYIPPLGFELERMDRFLHEIGNPVGIPVYIPVHASGEDHLYDYLGMTGVPLIPCSVFPEEPVTVMLTEGSCCDGLILEKMRRHLEAGGNVFLTSGFLRVMQGKGIEEFTSTRYTPGRMEARDFSILSGSWGVPGDFAYSRENCLFPVLDWKTNDGALSITSYVKDYHNPVLVYNYFANGTVFVMNVPDVFSQLYSLPGELLTFLRKQFSKDVPVYLECGPQVALFLYDNDTLIIESFLPHDAKVNIRVKKPCSGLRDIETGRKLPLLYEQEDEKVCQVIIEASGFKVYSLLP